MGCYKLKNIALFVWMIASFAVLEAVWSPPVVLPINPPTSSVNGAFDPAGNFGLIWLDSTSNNYLSSLYTYSTNNWSTPQTLVSAATSSATPAMGINGSATAVAAWVTTTETIEAALDTPAGWISLGTVVMAAAGQNLNPPVIAIDQQGNIMVVYAQDNGDTTTTIYAARLIGGVWVLTALSPSIATNSQNLFPIVALDANGDGIITYGSYDGTNLTIYAANYDKTGGTFTVTTLFSPTTPPLPPVPEPNLNLAISPAGNGIVCWEIKPNGVFAAVYTNGTWSTAQLIPDTLGTNIGDNNAPPIAINDAGQAILVFNTKVAPQTVQASSYNGTSWTTTTVATSPSNTSIGIPTCTIDPDGNGLVVYLTQYSNGGTTLYSSSRMSINGTWSSPAKFIASSANITYPFMVFFLPNDQALLAYGILQNMVFTLTDFDITVGSYFFELQPPSNFQGQVQRSQFLLQTDLIYVLSWSPSPDSRLGTYLIYRNGQLIGQTTGTTFEDHNRVKNETDVYTLVAISGDQTVQSAPLVTVVP